MKNIKLTIIKYINLKNIKLLSLLFVFISCSFNQLADKNLSQITRIEIENKGIADTITARISGSIYKEKSVYNFNFKKYEVLYRSKKSMYISHFENDFKYLFTNIPADTYQLNIVTPRKDTLKYPEKIQVESGEIKHIRIFVQ